MSKKKTPRKPRIKTTGEDAPAKKVSGLDAAAKVLAESKEPLNAKEMIERIRAQELWKSGGKTPHATIYAAIIREIAAKGSESRFRKAERGKFTAAS